MAWCFFKVRDNFTFLPVSRDWRLADDVRNADIYIADEVRIGTLSTMPFTVTSAASGRETRVNLWLPPAENFRF